MSMSLRESQKFVIESTLSTPKHSKVAIGNKSLIRVFVADDQTLFRESLRFMLESMSNVEVVGEARNGREAIQKVEKLKPDVVIMDIGMPIMNGIEATRQLCRRIKGIKILILSTRMYEDYLSEVIKAGASGYILKDSNCAELIKAIEEVNNGNAYLSPALSKTILNDYIGDRSSTKKLIETSPLTNREREILQLISEGYSNQQIAEQLCVSVKTVEAHKAHMVAKLALKGAADLTRYAIQTELMQVEL